MDNKRIASAKEITQFSGVDVRLYWDAVQHEILQHEGTSKPRSISKETFLELAQKLFPKWKDERQKYLTTFIMETLSEGIAGSEIEKVFNVFKKLYRVRVLKDEKDKLFTVMQVLK